MAAAPPVFVPAGAQADAAPAFHRHTHRKRRHRQPSEGRMTTPHTPNNPPPRDPPPDSPLTDELQRWLDLSG
jgi:hypothetical protein